MIVADNETAVDLLYYEAIAQTITRLVTHKPDEPLSIGVHGDWGAGKSSVLMMVEDAFAKEGDVLCVRFNGWLFQGFEDAKAVLVETIVDELRRKRTMSNKITEQIEKVLHRVNWMKVARKAGIYGITLGTGIPHTETIKDLSAIARTVLSNDNENIAPEILTALSKGLNEFFDKADENNAPEQMHAFREEFAELLKRAEVTRLVVLVDDLDRCLPKIAIETLEAIRLFLFVPRAAFVIAADEGMIEYAVRQHFPDLPIATGPATYARNYLEKLIQVPFRLPSLGYTETRIYITLLLVMIECGEESSEFQKLANMVRDILQRPWEGPGLNRETIEKNLGSVPDEVERSLDLSGRIAPILADGARGNPRQVKRFINTMMLRLAIAEERGFRDELNLSILAKIMLAERFAPELYDLIAQGSANTGVSKELSILESAVTQQHTDSLKEKSTQKEAKKSQTETPLPDWPNLEWAKQWAAIDPPLTGNDLRPYVFVTRDYRNVFGAVTSLSEFDELLAKLQGSQLQVKQLSTDIKRLRPLEAEQLFDALRAKVRDAENIIEEPTGIRGLAEIARQHQFLRRPLLSFLKNLPVSKIGPWVVGGWTGIFTEANLKDEFNTMLVEWTDQDENKPLKTAARAAIEIGKRRKRN